jgi:hypothetical protein
MSKMICSKWNFCQIGQKGRKTKRECFLLNCPIKKTRISCNVLAKKRKVELKVDKLFQDTWTTKFQWVEPYCEKMARCTM